MINLPGERKANCPRGFGTQHPKELPAGLGDEWSAWYLQEDKGGGLAHPPCLYPALLTALASCQLAITNTVFRRHTCHLKIHMCVYTYIHMHVYMLTHTHI